MRMIQTPKTDEATVLQNEIAHYRTRYAELLDPFKSLSEQMKRKKIKLFEDLATRDNELIKTLIELAQLTATFPLEGIAIGLFGQTSTGK
ncbi:unnamed protein product [Adineta ricciae]|uniref:Uncharacterized protein n=1 Tax=Adineta ricciae TaxID=249248 RepID=A0A814YXF9_ADIRI|nr:unnamed protein product [Adineta ricciae]CAF1235913.1 unnamed protein product [Adineta ricciae]